MRRVSSEISWDQESKVWSRIYLEHVVQKRDRTSLFVDTGFHCFVKKNLKKLKKKQLSFMA